MAAMRSRYRRHRRWWAIFTVLALATAFMVFFVAASSANLSGSKFESTDGNLVVNTAGNTDWANAPNLSAGQDQPTGQTDNAFGNGTKEDDNSVTVVNGSIPNSKADLARFAVAGETISGQSFLYLAWSRENQSGTVNFDFEINAAAQPDLTTPGAKTLNRTVNDLLINYSFQGGSNTPTLTLRKWAGSNWGTEQPLTGCSDGATNSATVSENLGGFTAVNRPAQQFGEAAINLTCAGVVPAGSCESFAGAYVKSRSSTSFTSEIKDFIAPVSLHLSNCAKLTIIKHTSPGGLNQSFGYTTTGGLSPSTFNLNDSATNTQVFDKLQPGTYTVSENADPTGFALNSITCSPKGTGTVATRTASVTLAAGDDVTCTFVNNQQLGAIKISKSSIKGTVLAGATFSITRPGSYSNSVTSGADGTVCVDGLVFGSYDVKETAAPSGYSIDDATTHTVSVGTNTTCSGTPSVSLSFTDTPLTDLNVEAKSQVAGGTQSSISCVDSNNASVGTGGALAEDSKLSATGLKPGTYTCTVVVDP